MSWVLIYTVNLTVCYYYVTYAFQSESTLCSCLNVKELLARTKWLWVRVPLQSLKPVALQEISFSLSWELLVSNSVSLHFFATNQFLWKLHLKTVNFSVYVFSVNICPFENVLIIFLTGYYYWNIHRKKIVHFTVTWGSSQPWLLCNFTSLENFTKKQSEKI